MRSSVFGARLAEALNWLRQGRLAEAEQTCAAVLQQVPGHPDGLHLMGLIQLQKGRPAEAERFLQRALRRGRREPAVLINLALAQVRGGRLSPAAQTAQALLRMAPDVVDGGLLAAEIAIRRGRPADVAAQLEPMAGRLGDPRLWLALADVHRHMGAYDRAASGYRIVLQGAPDTEPALYGLAKLPPPFVMAAERTDLLRKACALSPGRPGPLAELALALEQVNALEEAEAVAAEAAGLAPGAPLTVLARARLSLRRGDPDGALAGLADMAPDAATEVRAQADALRAQIHHAQKRPMEAVAAMRRAHETLARIEAARAIDRQAVPALIDRLLAWMAAQSTSLPTAVAAGAGRPADGAPPPPVFFVGFPRSGTTLMERMLAAHPRLRGSDELPALDSLRAEMERLLGRPFTYPDHLETLTAEERDRLVARYWEIVESGLGPARGRRLVDKLPLNILNLPLAATLFPGAGVLVAERDPRDVIVSCFFQLFALNEAMINLNEPVDAARLYRRVQALLEAAEAFLPLTFVRYAYEHLVSDPEAILRRVLTGLGIPWDGGVLDHVPASRRMPTGTPNHAAVLEAPHRRAVGRWAAYRDDPALRAAFALLDASGL